MRFSCIEKPGFCPLFSCFASFSFFPFPFFSSFPLPFSSEIYCPTQFTVRRQGGQSDPPDPPSRTPLINIYTNIDLDIDILMAYVGVPGGVQVQRLF